MRTRARIPGATLCRVAMTLTLFTLAAGGNAQAQAPDLLWAVGTGSTGGDIALAVDEDAAGNVYQVGDFFSTVDFDPGGRHV